MKSNYWFNRGKSQEQKHSSSPQLKKYNSNSSKLIPDDTFKNQIKISADRIQQISKILQSLQKYSELHNTIIQNNQVSQIRCFIHNSNIILYCHTDHELLCSNCVFEMNNHRKHYLTEAIKSTTNLLSDFGQNEKKVKTKTSSLIKINNIWQNLQIQLQKKKFKSIQTLTTTFEQMSLKLSTIFLQTKNKIQQFYDSGLSSIQSVSKNLNRLIKSLRLDNNILPIKHVFFRQTFNHIKQIQKIMPDNKMGEQMILIIERICHNIVRAFKSIISNINF